jgi:uncharacterized protein (TIGR03435 family)
MKTCALCLITFYCNCFAQPAAQLSPVFETTFDVASVRLSGPASNSGALGLRTTPRSLTITNVSLFGCIQRAYQPVLTDGPDWLSEVRLDIVAKTAKPVDDKELFMMLRTLLRDRMGVQAHTEKREMPAYALTLGKDGPKFSESGAAKPATVPTGAQVLSDISLDTYAAMLSKPLGRPVINATGLHGHYDLVIDTSEAPGPGDPVASVNFLISMLRQQLNLKLEPRKEMIDVLVIDHADKKPKEN